MTRSAEIKVEPYLDERQAAKPSLAFDNSTSFIIRVLASTFPLFALLNLALVWGLRTSILQNSNGRKRVLQNAAHSSKVQSMMSLMKCVTQHIHISSRVTTRPNLNQHQGRQLQQLVKHQHSHLKRISPNPICCGWCKLLWISFQDKLVPILVSWISLQQSVYNGGQLEDLMSKWSWPWQLDYASCLLHSWTPFRFVAATDKKGNINEPICVRSL